MFFIVQLLPQRLELWFVNNLLFLGYGLEEEPGHNDQSYDRQDGNYLRNQLYEDHHLCYYYKN